MSELPAREWIVYGLELVGYLLAFVVVGSLLSVFGLIMFLSAMESGGQSALPDLFIGMTLAILGFLAIIGGFAGASYKIIVDGLSRALEAHT
jgi:hypothetical protein